MAAINPTCPFCGRRKGIQPAGPDTFKCPACGAMFDSDPEEGGSHYSDPSKRLEMEEAEREHKKNRLGRRESRKSRSH